MYTEDVKVGDIHYRCMPCIYELISVLSTPPVQFQPYKVTKLTPCGYKVKSDWWGEKEKLVLYASKKKWAYRTKEEALDSFVRRKTRHLAILKGQVESISLELSEAIAYQERILAGIEKFQEE